MLMAIMKPGSKLSYVAVAVGAAMLGAGAMWSLPKVLAVANAQTAAPPGLLTQPLSDLPGREVRMNILDRDPGATSARHRHPGHHTFGYVLEGTYEFAINGEAPRLLKAGEAFYEPPTALHTTSRNPSPDKRARILIFMVADQKNPSTVPE